jgi:23S rRNA pseudouridine2605 synthase/23S rRNA pseudouridine2604 synthase
MAEMRLQKFLSAAGVCSRRKGETYILAGRVSVNGRTVTELGTKVDPDRDAVSVDGNPVVSSVERVYIALHKPRGYVSSCEQKEAKTVLELIDIPERVYPIGRLDKDSTGLLLMTNDGQLHQRLAHPSFDHEKEYDVTVALPITDGALRKMASGMPLMGSRTRPAVVRRIGPRRFRVILKEGRNRQIRRMVRKLGNHVTRLVRLRTANIKLGKLPPGQWRRLTAAESKKLLMAVTDKKMGE